MKKFFDASEIEDLIDSTEVESMSNGESRWYDNMTSIVEEDGKFYALDWQRGLTENQDNEYYDGEYPEVFPVDDVQAQATRRWLTEEQLKAELSSEEILQSDIESLKKVSNEDTINEELEKLANANLNVVIELLEQLPLINSVDSNRVSSIATIKYLKNLQSLVK